MNRYNFERGAIAAFSIVLLCGLSADAAVPVSPRYVLTNVGTLYAGSTEANAINNNGVIVGESFKSGSGSRAYRTRPNLPINQATDDLGAILDYESIAFGVNASGQSTGWVQTNNVVTYTYSVARYPASGTNVASSSRIGTLGGNQAVGWDINNAGQVVGVSEYAGQTTDRAFRTKPNQSINPATDDLGTLGGAYASAYGINNSGQVTGLASLASLGGAHAFRTKPNQSINQLTDDLGTLGATDYSEGRDINDAGWVVGTSATTNGDARAFLVPPDRSINPLTDNLGVLAGFDESHATAVNNSQSVVGYVFKFSGQTYRPFVFDGTAMYDLNDLVTPTSLSGWVLTEANDINDKGQIVGNGLFNGQHRAFLLTPIIPEPSGICLIATALVAAPWLKHRRRDVCGSKSLA